MTRRQLLIGAVASPFLRAAKTGPTLCIFSKHMAQLNWEDLGKTAKQMGFGGVDLTVRTGGHVPPPRTATDLPRAVEAVRSHGLTVPMITTGLTSGSDPTARPILSTAVKLGIPRYKLGYLPYNDSHIEQRLIQVKESVLSLVAIGKEVGIQAMYHNHSGNYVGEAVWDIRDIIRDIDDRWIGYYFDPCHATAEGGLYGWRASLDLVTPRLKAVAAKDFYWEKTGGKWTMQMCPLGQGMVDWPAVFARLAAIQFAGPISLHMEYETKDEMEAVARDFGVLKNLAETAYGHS